MKSVFALLVLAACTAPSPPSFEGTWNRDGANGLRESLVIEGDTYYSRVTYDDHPDWHIKARGTWGHTAEERLVWFISEDARSFDATYYLDDETLVFGAFVPTSEVRFRAVRRYTTRLDVEMHLDDFGFHAWWIDPIWGDHIAEAGDVERIGETVVLDDFKELRVYPDGSLGGDDPIYHLFDTVSFWHLGTTFVRAPSS